MTPSRLKLAIAAPLLTLLVWGYATPAYAYIDPTAAGAALQSLYIMVASALMALALVPGKIVAGFQRLKAWFRPHTPTPPDRDQAP
jgi:hypothetical protein